MTILEYSIYSCFCCTTERYNLIFWPSEETYSIVQESRVVEPKDPSVDETVKVKEGGKVFLGKTAAVGIKANVEAQMSELEGNRRERSPAKTNGELIYTVCACTWTMYGRCQTCMYMYVYNVRTCVIFT